MPALKNSYPRRAYRRKRRATLNSRRKRQRHYTYDTGYDYIEREDGTSYVRQVAWGPKMKKSYKVQSRRAARRARYNKYGQHGSYRKAYDLWWNIY